MLYPNKFFTVCNHTPDPPASSSTPPPTSSAPARPTFRSAPEPTASRSPWTQSRWRTRIPLPSRQQKHTASSLMPGRPQVLDPEKPPTAEILIGASGTVCQETAVPPSSPLAAPAHHPSQIPGLRAMPPLRPQPRRTSGARARRCSRRKRTGATRRCAGRTCRDATARCSAWGAATSSSRGAPPCTSGPPDPPPPARQARLRHSWAPHARCTWPRSAGARPARPSRRGDGRGYLVPTPRAAGGSRGGEPRMGVP